MSPKDQEHAETRARVARLDALMVSAVFRDLESHTREAIRAQRNVTAGCLIGADGHGLLSDLSNTDRSKK